MAASLAVGKETTRLSSSTVRLRGNRWTLAAIAVLFLMEMFSWVRPHLQASPSSTADVAVPAAPVPPSDYPAAQRNWLLELPREEFAAFLGTDALRSCLRRILPELSEGTGETRNELEEFAFRYNLKVCDGRHREVRFCTDGESPEIEGTVLQVRWYCERVDPRFLAQILVAENRVTFLRRIFVPRSLAEAQITGMLSLLAPGRSVRFSCLVHEGSGDRMTAGTTAILP